MNNIFKTVILLSLTKSLFAVCVPNVSCEPVFLKDNRNAIVAIDNNISVTKNKLENIKVKYVKIDMQLIKNVSMLKRILAEEILVNKYLGRILFQIKKNDSITAVKAESRN